MAGREAAVARLLVVPVGFLRRGDEARIARILERLGDLEGDLVHAAQDQHVDVLDRDVLLRPEGGDGDVLDDHHDAFGVGRDTVRRLWVLGIGREGVQGLGAGDADQIRAQIAGELLDRYGVHCTDLPDARRAGPGLFSTLT